MEQSTNSEKNTMLFAPLPTQSGLQLRISERRLLLMFGDALCVLGAVLLSLRIWAFVAEDPFDSAFILPQIPWFFTLLVLWFIIAGANDFYDLATISRRSDALQRLFIITLQMLVVYVVVFFFSDRDALPRLFIVYYGLSSFVMIAIWRLVNPALIGWAAAPRRALIIGDDWASNVIIKVLNDEAPNLYALRGVIASTIPVGDKIENLPVIGTADDLMNFVLRDNIREVIVTSTHELSGEIFQAVMDAYEAGVVITPMPILYERLTDRVPVEHVGNHWSVVLPISGNSAFNPYPILKRTFDIVLSLIGMIGFIILLPFLALIIRLDSPGSIFFMQERTGLNGKPFKMIKFRTMVQNAEKETGAVFAQANDPRKTRVGKFMRKTRLDEIPQLMNVLRGDMSLIGPRPERPEHIERLQEKIPFYRTRHTIRPGVTGWAQVRYQYGATDEDSLVKLQYDLYYIRHQNVMLDLNILIRTVGKVIKMSGQ